MSAIALITDLRGRGVKLGVRGDTLIIAAPKGVVAPRDMAALRDQKAEIIRALNSRDESQRPGPRDDTPDAWRGWHQERIGHHLNLGRDDDLAGSLTWGEAENIWHQRHGTEPDPSNCAGCGELLSGRERLTLSDGAAVHWDETAGLDCLVAHGMRWRAEADAGLMGLDLEPPDELSTEET